MNKPLNWYQQASAAPIQEDRGNSNFYYGRRRDSPWSAANFAELERRVEELSRRLSSEQLRLYAQAASTSTNDLHVVDEWAWEREYLGKHLYKPKEEAPVPPEWGEVAP